MGILGSLKMPYPLPIHGTHLLVQGIFFCGGGRGKELFLHSKEITQAKSNAMGKHGTGPAKLMRCTACKKNPAPIPKKNCSPVVFGHTNHKRS